MLSWISYRRGVFLAYLGTGAALALTRIALFAWVNHRYASHTVTETVARLTWGLYPEALLSIHTRLGLIYNTTLFFLLYGLLLVVGSFVLATPILLLTCLPRRGPIEKCSTSLTNTLAPH